ncbi:EAL domain-containing protein [Escherichia coli]|nr:EAL domain-containing protein [Escherichia coli]HBP9017799.1 EAL domain-containing protein [Escherichia coli]
MNTTNININIIEYDSIINIELPYLLSEIEGSLLSLLLQGYSVNEISKQRKRSIKTISCQKIKLYKKLGVTNDLTLWRDIFLLFKVSIQSKNICHNNFNKFTLKDIHSKHYIMSHYNIYYQPIYNTKNWSISGCDITISPKNICDNILSLDSGLINSRKTNNILPYLFRRLDKLFTNIKYHLPHNFFITVNINPEDIITCDLERECLHFIKVFGNDRIRLTLQLSTKDDLCIIQKKQSSLNRLRNNNIYLSLNDFGIGYAELSHLQNIPLSYISLHKTIFHNIEDSRLTDIIATTIIDLSKQLNIDVIADGIETKNQAEYMIGKGIKYLKGPVLSSPLSEDEFLRKLLESFNKV